MNKKEIYKNKAIDLTITQIDTSIHHGNYISIKFGDVELSINKQRRVRDIAVLINGAITGVIWDDKKLAPNDTDWSTNEGIDAIKLHYLKRDEAKLKTIKKAFEILKGDE